MLNNSEIANISAKLSSAVRGGRSVFFHSLLEAYGFPKNSIKRAEDSMEKIESRICSIKQRLLYFECPEGENLEQAYLDVMEDVKNRERFVFVTDFSRIMSKDMLSGKGIDIAFDELPDNYQFFLPWCGRETVETDFENPADVKAAREMGHLFEVISNLNKDNPEMTEQALNIFLSRLLFCFFADDTGIFSRNAFRDALVLNTAEDGRDTSQFISGLFNVLDMKDHAGVHPCYAGFPYVNGGLFRDHFPVPKLDRACRRKILECCSVDWSDINPDIFGSMFQTVISEEQRRNLGQHYTSVVNIMKVLRPLFLDELHEKLDGIFSEPVGRARDRKLDAFRKRLSEIVVFDPACGSGNFLIIAYKELCHLEMEALTGYAEAVLPFLSIKLENFYGIEIDEFPCDVARLALWLAQHQINRECYEKFGNANPTLPLTTSGNIHFGNALDEDFDWNDFCPADGKEVYVCGNPPYQGGAKLDSRQKEERDRISTGIHNNGFFDYITCWFILSASYMAHRDNVKVAFVTTNSVNQGMQVSLWPFIFSKKVEIAFAYEAFKWRNNARDVAGVTVTIIGLRIRSEKPKHIYNEMSKRTVVNINPYLVDSSDNIVSQCSKPTTGIEMIRGCQFTDDGNLSLTTEEKDSLIKSFPDASLLIHPLAGSDEFIKGKERWCLWISTSMLHKAESIPFVAERLEANLKYRSNAEKKTGDAYKLRDRYWQAREFYDVGLSAIIVPRVSSEQREYIPMGYLPGGTVITDSAFAIYHAPEWLFAVLTSRLHMVWMRAVSGKLEGRYRYSNTLVYNTFPFPTLTDTQKKALADSAERILNAREDHYEMTMAQLYDPDKMPEDLRAAHESNDLLVDSLYRKSGFDSDEDRLSELFRRYEANMKGAR